MADSKENESLGGLARSIDSLFSGTKSTSPSEESEEGAEGPEGGAAPRGVPGAASTGASTDSRARSSEREVGDLPRVPAPLDEHPVQPERAEPPVRDDPPADPSRTARADTGSVLDWPPLTAPDGADEPGAAESPEREPEKTSDPGGAEVMFDSLDALPDVGSGEPEVESARDAAAEMDALSEAGRSLAAGREERLFENLTLMEDLPPPEPFVDPFAADEEEDPAEMLAPGEQPTLVEGLPPARPIRDPFEDEENPEEILAPGELPTLVEGLPPARPMETGYLHPTEVENELEDGELPTLAPGWSSDVAADEPESEPPTPPVSAPGPGSEPPEEERTAAPSPPANAWTFEAQIGASLEEESAAYLAEAEAAVEAPRAPAGDADVSSGGQPRDAGERSADPDHGHVATPEDSETPSDTVAAEYLDPWADAPAAEAAAGEGADPDPARMVHTEASPSDGPPVPPPGEPEQRVPWPTAAPDVLVARPRRGGGRNPDPLTLAVEAYLRGSVDADEVRSTGARLTEERAYDAVAAAVERLAQHAYRSEDASALELAKAMLGPLVLSRLVQRLGHEREEARRSGYREACLALGEEMAVAIRDELAETDDRAARRVYFDALVEMDPLSRPVIEGMVESENKFLARNGVALIAEVGGERAEELVMGAVWDSDPRVRREAIRTIARLELDSAEQLVLQLLEDSDRKVRMEAIKYASDVGLERAVRPILLTLDKADDAEDILVLLKALGRLGDPGAVPSIEKHAVPTFFRRPQTEVRIAAYRALKQIGTPHARQLLEQARDDREDAVRVAVEEILQEA